MPTLITRAKALRQIQDEGGTPNGLMCALRNRKVGPVHVVFEDDEMLVMLLRYVRRWGHLTVMPNMHVTSVHLHIHVIPLHDSDDKPSDISGWQGEPNLGPLQRSASAWAGSRLLAGQRCQRRRAVSRLCLGVLRSVPYSPVSCFQVRCWRNTRWLGPRRFSRSRSTSSTPAAARRGRRRRIVAARAR